MYKLFALALITSLMMSCSAQDFEWSNDVIDMKYCNISVPEVNKIAELTTDEGDKLLSKGGGLSLIEIRIEGASPIDGCFFINPRIPKLLCFEEENIHTFSALATGIKGRNPVTNETIEVFISDPETTMYSGSVAKDTISYYSVFELPDNIKNYKLMLPVKITDKITIKE